METNDKSDFWNLNPRNSDTFGRFFKRNNNKESGKSPQESPSDLTSKEQETRKAAAGQPRSVANEVRDKSFAENVKGIRPKITEDLINKAVESAKKIADIQTDDELLRTNFDEALVTFVKARAAARQARADSLELWNEEHTKRGELLEALNKTTLNTPIEVPKEQLLGKMINAIDLALGLPIIGRKF